MAKIVIVSTTNSIKVDFGTYYTAPLEEKSGVWRKENVSFVERANYIIVNIEGEKEWRVSFDGNSTDATTFEIDTINGTTITSNTVLMTELESMIA